VSLRVASRDPFCKIRVEVMIFISAEWNMYVLYKNGRRSIRLLKNSIELPLFSGPPEWSGLSDLQVSEGFWALVDLAAGLLNKQTEHNLGLAG